MAVNKAYEQYKENSIGSAKPEELTLMLYNGLIKFIMRAQLSIDKKDMESAHNNIIKAQNIVIEFQMTLDMNFDVSNGLMLLYDYMYRRLVDANIKKDKDMLEEVLGFAKELRDTWTTAMKMRRDMSEEEQKVIIQQVEDEVKGVIGEEQLENLSQVKAVLNDEPQEVVDDLPLDPGDALLAELDSPTNYRSAVLPQKTEKTYPVSEQKEMQEELKDEVAVAEGTIKPIKPLIISNASQYAAKYSQVSKSVKNAQEAKNSIQERL